MGVDVSRPSATPATPPRFGDARWLRRTAWASLVVNVAIVVTGGTVRLTGSGLGCPTWPRCTEESFRPHGEMNIHVLIEFGNRMVTFLIAAVAVATLVVVWRSGHTRLRLPAVLLAIGVPAQAVLGGVTVLTGLNPWTVSLHLVVSMAMICVAVLLLRSVLLIPDRPGDRPPRSGRLGTPVLVTVARLATAVFVVGWGVLYLGTVVTGSGPYAGDVDAPRNGLDPRSMSQLHTDAVFLLVGLVAAVLLALRGVDRATEVVRAARTSAVVVLVQGTIGFVQYFTGLPVVLVGMHLFGAALFAAAMTWLLLSAQDAARGAQPATSGSSATPTKSSDR